ncbi:helix-turn-helix domain-containing protein [Rudanella paleaurantiibacter]|uniref:Helix-turn-helix domain-containing protein n=1 Tax=Rudanella paleaurantiibacter TaxID=2614655 RepID=A0A7J5TZW5_9BACT|nr:helix-turn-helix domain-containing protein [Rudanella paleaurantiibacter]KAB7730487.1 helix-turn-helix domain-containing protein [Rudanella paleaurantiibacter]
MLVDLEKLQNDVNEIKEMLQRFTGRSDSQPPVVAISDEVLDYGQAAELLGIGVQTLYGKVSRREIPFSKVRRRTYFSKLDLMAWVRSQRTPTVVEQTAQYEQTRVSHRARQSRQQPVKQGRRL